MPINHLVNQPHQSYRLCQRSHNTLVVLDIIEGEGAALAIFKPLLTDLIAANMKSPYLKP